MVHSVEFFLQVVAVVELHEGASITIKELQEWGLKFAPRYQLPSSLFIVSKYVQSCLFLLLLQLLCLCLYVSIFTGYKEILWVK